MDYDTSIVRHLMRIEDFQMRGQGMSSERLKGIKKGLLALHTLETMAANIYRFQITNESCELNRKLIAAMCNEMTHLQDFQVKLFEYGWRPSKLRWMYWTVGFIAGFASQLMGTKAILRTGIWVETKAVHHYGELLKTIDWEEGTRKIIEKYQADEYEHIKTWKALLSA
ncbi:MAG TPA: demethoxyubiquinone hydroxylase family protein [Candidatus Brocadiia bacterium]|nr:demethoxyubiquinone hydroxylase family protein [Candidatus Brocadiales bacterium]